MNKLVLLLGLMLSSITIVLGQNRTVYGTVTDVTGLPLIGVTVQVLNQSDAVTGTVTDFDGKFELSVARDADTLQFSYIGYATMILPITDETNVEVTMKEDAQQLEEVVVVGYGIQKKRVSTGSISKISSANLDGFQVQDVQSSLEGQVAGLIVSESSGQPGAGKSILIRGISTNGDNTPLFIVDGLQVNSIDNISPGDIESVDILKDAAAGAIYGARAANGVIIITTKKGTEGKSSITYEGFYSTSQPWKTPEMLGSADYITLTREKFANGNQTNSLNSLGFPTSETSLPNTNWMDVIFEPAVVQNHRISAAGKNFFLGMEYWDQNGVVGGDKSSYQRYAVRLNASKEINDYVTIGENLYVTRINAQSIGVNDAFGTVIADAFAYDPITDVYDENGQYGFAQSDWVKKEYVNPLSRLFIINGGGHSDQVLGNMYFELRPIDGLRFRSDVGVDYLWNNYRAFTPDFAFHDAFVNPTNDVVQGYNYYETLQFENYLNYAKQLGRHNVNVVVGTSYRTTSNEFAGGTSSSIPDAVKFDPYWQYLDAGEDTTDLTYGGAGVDYALISYYGRLIYDLDDKYLFTATVRRDGSSNFGKANRWGVFPSFSLGWILSDEPFFQIEPISFLKVRGSWGINGNDRISPLAYAARVENVFTYPYGNNLITGASLATPPNPNIKWEESRQVDIGLEMRLFNDQLSAEFDYYIKNTQDLLMSQVIPGYLGATNNPISNLGEIQNKGFEANLSYRFALGKVRINTNLNYTTFTNEVIDVAGDAGYIQGYTWPVRNTAITRMTEGFPVGHFVGYRSDGIFQSQEEVFSHINSSGDLLQPKAKPGDIKFLDVNGDGVIDNDDIGDIGSPWPDHIIGFTLGANYKGFDFNMILSTQLGHEIFRAYERSDITFTNYQSFWLDRWTPDNPGNDLPRLVSNDPNNNQRPSDFYLEDGSFLRLRNLQVGYSLPTALLEKVKLSGLRIYFTANNLFTLTGYRGFDPEIGTNGWILDTGIDKGFYPANKTIGGGIKITM
ncbi:MAG: TonB-dependent receptor [Saprospiraceae bacterium]|nr:TonB-dependent receptor [Saprospiraceae bacterium]